MTPQEIHDMWEYLYNTLSLRDAFTRTYNAIVLDVGDEEPEPERSHESQRQMH